MERLRGAQNSGVKRRHRTRLVPAIVPAEKQAPVDATNVHPGLGTTFVYMAAIYFSTVESDIIVRWVRATMAEHADGLPGSTSLKVVRTIIAPLPAVLDELIHHLRWNSVPDPTTLFAVRAHAESRRAAGEMCASVVREYTRLRRELAYELQRWPMSGRTTGTEEDQINAHIDRCIVACMEAVRACYAHPADTPILSGEQDG